MILGRRLRAMSSGSPDHWRRGCRTRRRVSLHGAQSPRHRRRRRDAAGGGIVAAPPHGRPRCPPHAAPAAIAGGGERAGRTAQGGSPHRNSARRLQWLQTARRPPGLGAAAAAALEPESKFLPPSRHLLHAGLIVKDLSLNVILLVMFFSVSASPSFLIWLQCEREFVIFENAPRSFLV